MNKERRAQIAEAIKTLTDYKTAIEAIATFEDMRDNIETAKDEEQDYYDNLPESMQRSDKGSNAEEAVSNLETAHSNMESAIDAISSVITHIDDALEALESAKE